jgi:integration host factor subunit beta
MTTHDVSSRAGDETVRRVFAVVAEALLNRGTVEIEGFGTFELVVRKPRTARNPRTGERIAVPAKSVVKFKAAGALKRRAAEKPPAGAT